MFVQEKIFIKEEIQNAQLILKSVSKNLNTLNILKIIFIIKQISIMIEQIPEKIVLEISTKQPIMINHVYQC